MSVFHCLSCANPLLSNTVNLAVKTMMLFTVSQSISINFFHGCKEKYYGDEYLQFSRAVLHVDRGIFHLLKFSS